MISYDICLSPLTDLVWYSLVASVLLQMALFHSFLYGWVVFHCIHLYNTFIHSSVDRHLVCYHVLVTVDKLLWTRGCMHLFRLEFCLDVCLGEGLLDHMVILFLAFWGTSILFSTVAVGFVYFKYTWFVSQILLNTHTQTKNKHQQKYSFA